MKKMIFVLAFMMATTICVEGHNDPNYVTISVQTFYDELQPYGDWINTPEYGYVWRPYTDDPDFRPYASRGNWVYTDLGWTWVSDYRWGWAPFHYGRWYFDDYLGWAWIPGYEWAPAWVTWGSYNDYWAWAPMGPNMQVNFNFTWYAPQFWWTFVPRQHFCSNNWHAYIYNPGVQVTHITYITNVYNNNNYRNNHGTWFYGPRVKDVERHLNTRVCKMEMVDSDRPENLIVRNNRVSIYRPAVTNARNDVRPARYRDAESLRRDQNSQRNNLRAPRNMYETRSGSVNSTRREPAKEMVKETVTRYGNMFERTTVQNQQPRQSNRVATSGNYQPSGIDRNNGRGDTRNNLSGTRTSSKPNMESRSAQSPSSQRSRNR